MYWNCFVETQWDWINILFGTEERILGWNIHINIDDLWFVKSKGIHAIIILYIYCHNKLKYIQLYIEQIAFYLTIYDYECMALVLQLDW